MAGLQIFLFGCVRVIVNDLPVEEKLTPTSKKLLAFLLLQRQRLYPREVLADKFWSESSQEKARASLNTALWRLRCILEPEGVPRGTYLIVTSQGEVGFNPHGQCWLDTDAFESCISQGLLKPYEEIDPQKVEELERNLALYQGELLEDMYSDWAIFERERLRSLYIKCLSYLMNYHKRHAEYEKSIDYGQLILKVDPLREEVHRELMRLYQVCGMRPLAVRQFNLCRQLLDDELHIVPMDETWTLYKQISTGDATAEALLESGSTKVSIQMPLVLLRQIARSMERLCGQFQDAIALIDQQYKEKME